MTCLSIPSSSSYWPSFLITIYSTDSTHTFVTFFKLIANRQLPIQGKEHPKKEEHKALLVQLSTASLLLFVQYELVGGSEDYVAASVS